MVFRWLDDGLRSTLRCALYLPACGAEKFADRYGLLDSVLVVCAGADELEGEIYARNMFGVGEAT